MSMIVLTAPLSDQGHSCSPLTSQSKDIIFCFLFSGPNQDCCWLPHSRQGVMRTEWIVANLYNNQQADAVHSKQWVFGRCWWKKQPDNVGLYLDPPKKPLNMALMQFHFIQNQWGVKLNFFPFLSSAAWILGDSGRVIKKGGVLECFNSSVLDVVKWTIIIPRQINSRLRSVLAVVIWVVGCPLLLCHSCLIIIYSSPLLSLILINY